MDFIANYFSPFVFDVRINKTFEKLHLQYGRGESSHAVSDNNFAFTNLRRVFTSTANSSNTELYTVSF